MENQRTNKRFLEQTYDKFNNRTDTKWKSFTHKNLGVGYAFHHEQIGSKPYRSIMIFLDLRHVKSPEVDSLVIDYTFTSHDWYFLRNGKMVINLDGAENITLEPHETSADSKVVLESVDVEEKGFWPITKEELKKICDAKNIAVRISGDTKYFELEGKGLLRFQFMCRSFYGDLYDDNSYDSWLNSIVPKGAEAKSGGACFIATAAMGDYDHPVVMDLRRFRDNWLLQRNWGKDFTKWYYTHGPKAAKVIEKSTVLKRITYYVVVKPLQFLTKKLR